MAFLKGVWIRLAGTVALTLPLIAQAPAAAVPTVDEYQAKAAFLYNFLKFVEWPASAFPRAGDPIRICILGRDPFGDSLQHLLKGKETGGRPFAASVVSDARQAAGCHMLFV